MTTKNRFAVAPPGWTEVAQGSYCARPSSSTLRTPSGQNPSSSIRRQGSTRIRALNDRNNLLDTVPLENGQVRMEQLVCRETRSNTSDVRHGAKTPDFRDAAAWRRAYKNQKRKTVEEIAEKPAVSHSSSGSRQTRRDSGLAQSLPVGWTERRDDSLTTSLPAQTLTQGGAPKYGLSDSARSTTSLLLPSSSYRGVPACDPVLAALVRESELEVDELRSLADSQDMRDLNERQYDRRYTETDTYQDSSRVIVPPLPHARASDVSVVPEVRSILASSSAQDDPAQVLRQLQNLLEIPVVESRESIPQQRAREPKPADNGAAPSTHSEPTRAHNEALRQMQDLLRASMLPGERAAVSEFQPAQSHEDPPGCEDVIEVHADGPIAGDYRFIGRMVSTVPGAPHTAPVAIMECKFWNLRIDGDASKIAAHSAEKPQFKSRAPHELQNVPHAEEDLSPHSNIPDSQPAPYPPSPCRASEPPSAANLDSNAAAANFVDYGTDGSAYYGSSYAVPSGDASNPSRGVGQQPIAAQRGRVVPRSYEVLSLEVLDDCD